MGKKKKAKRVNPKRERYAKFRKDKPSSMTYSVPDLPEEQIAQRREDEKKVEGFWRYYRRTPERFVNERKARSKR